MEEETLTVIMMAVCLGGGGGQPAFYLHCTAPPSPPLRRSCQTLEMIQMQALPRKLPLALTLPSLWASARRDR